MKPPWIGALFAVLVVFLFGCQVGDNGVDDLRSLWWSSSVDGLRIGIWPGRLTKESLMSKGYVTVVLENTLTSANGYRSVRPTYPNFQLIEIDSATRMFRSKLSALQGGGIDRIGPITSASVCAVPPGAILVVRLWLSEVGIQKISSSKRLSVQFRLRIEAGEWSSPMRKEHVMRSEQLWTGEVSSQIVEL